MERFVALCRSIWTVSWRSFIVGLRGYSNKTSRRFATKYLHLGGIEVLNHVKATYLVDYADKDILNSTAPIIFMSNHLSLFDLPLIVATIPKTIRVVIKKELTKVPFLGKAAIASEQIIVDRKNKLQNKSHFYQDAKFKLNSGIVLWIFPEGTRSRTGKLQSFKLGGFRLAHEIGAIIIPVAIVGTDKILAAKKMLPHLRQHIELHIGKPIDSAAYRHHENAIELLAEQTKNAITTLKN